ncbi:hypothetical protein D5282_18520 [bacterium 1xD8-48]|nr:hypothetical protein [bacterium 1xD8-48]
MNDVACANSGNKEITAVVPSPETEEKPYKFRKLNSTDLFPMIKVISKVGVDELIRAFDDEVVSEIRDAREQGEAEQKSSETDEKLLQKEDTYFLVGVKIALKVANKILERLPSCEQEIYLLLASVSGMTVKEVKNLEINVFMEMILDFVTKEEFADFFRVASKYIKRLGL